VPEGTGRVNRDFALWAGRYMHCRIAPPRATMVILEKKKADGEVKNAEEC